MPGGSIPDGGAFPSHGSSVSRSSRGFGTLYCRGGGQVKGAWGFKPSRCTWLPTTLPATCVFQLGKVVSATLGAPPPNLDTQEIGHSLAVDQDEESILSDSYSDHHSSTVDSGTMQSKQTTRSTIKNRKLGPLSTETKMDTSPVKRIVREIVIRNMRSPKRVRADMGQISLVVTLLDPETQMGVMNVVVMANTRDHTAVTVPQIVARQSSNEG